MWDKTSGFARYLQAHDYLLLFAFANTDRNFPHHCCIKKFQWKRLCNCCISNWIKISNVRNTKAKQFLTLSDELFQKMYHKSDEEEELTCSLLQNDAELQSSAQTEGKHSINSQGNEQFEVQYSDPGIPFKLKSHREAISQQFLSILISWTYL